MSATIAPVRADSIRVLNDAMMRWTNAYTNHAGNQNPFATATIASLAEALCAEFNRVLDARDDARDHDLERCDTQLLELAAVRLAEKFQQRTKEDQT